MREARLLLVGVAAGLLAGCQGFGPYQGLVVSDNPGTLPLGRPARGLRVTYLGTNGYLLQSPEADVLIDPYFSRPDLSQVAWDVPIEPNPERIGRAMARLPRRIDLILVTHGHLDHLMDAPVVARRTGAQLASARTQCLLAESAGLGPDRLIELAPGQTRRIGAVTVRAIAVEHDRIVGQGPPFPGVLTAPPPERPHKASDWILGTPLAYVIEMDGARVYVDSGGTPDKLPPADVGPVDLAICGVALPLSRQRLPAALAVLQPRFFLPSHQDDFFRPVADGFYFAAFSDMPEVERELADRPGVGRLILLDYFKPWTLPPRQR